MKQLEDVPGKEHYTCVLGRLPRGSCPNHDSSGTNVKPFMAGSYRMFVVGARFGMHQTLLGAFLPEQPFELAPIHSAAGIAFGLGMASCSSSGDTFPRCSTNVSCTFWILSSKVSGGISASMECHFHAPIRKAPFAVSHQEVLKLPWVLAVGLSPVDTAIPALASCQDSKRCSGRTAAPKKISLLLHKT